MTSLVDALTEQIQLWLGDSATINSHDVATMLIEANEKAFADVHNVKICIEGEPKGVSVASKILKEFLHLTEGRLDNHDIGNGNIRRELILPEKTPIPEEPAPRPGNLNPQVIAPPETKAQKPRQATPNDLIYNALTIISQGLLDFPTNDEGQCKFNSAYPASFKAGLGQLTAYFLSQGTIISDSLEYWRLFSKPLKEWPHMPQNLQSPDPLIDFEGRPTILTHYLAKQRPEDN